MPPGQLDHVRDLFEGKGLDAVWAWAHDGKGACEQAKRCDAVARFAGNRKAHPHPGDPDWQHVQSVYRGERDELQRRCQQSQEADWRGHKPVLGALGERVVAKANSLGMYVTSTNDGTHAPTSYHYQDRAIDVGFIGAQAGAIETFQRWLLAEYPNAREVFGPVNSLCLKNGVRITLAEGSDLENLHDSHVHFAY